MHTSYISLSSVMSPHDSVDRSGTANGVHIRPVCFGLSPESSQHMTLGHLRVLLYFIALDQHCAIIGKTPQAGYLCCTCTSSLLSLTTPAVDPIDCWPLDFSIELCKTPLKYSDCDRNLAIVTFLENSNINPKPKPNPTKILQRI